jgi:hypothetical protein
MHTQLPFISFFLVVAQWSYIPLPPRQVLFIWWVANCNVCKRSIGYRMDGWLVLVGAYKIILIGWGITSVLGAPSSKQARLPMDGWMEGRKEKGGSWGVFVAPSHQHWSIWDHLDLTSPSFFLVCFTPPLGMLLCMLILHLSVQEMCMVNK